MRPKPAETVAVKNKNPLNLRPLHNDTWRGQIGIDTNPATGSFCVFRDNIHGVRAAVINMRSLIRAYGANTLHKLIYKWAPPNDPHRANHTDAYIARVLAYCYPDQVQLPPWGAPGTNAGDVYFDKCRYYADSQFATYDLGWLATEGFGDDDIPMLVKIIRAMNIVEAGSASIDDATAMMGIQLALGISH